MLNAVNIIDFEDHPLRSAIAAARLNQYEVARKINCSQASLSKWLRGVDTPMPEHVEDAIKHILIVVGTGQQRPRPRHPIVK